MTDGKTYIVIKDIAEQLEETEEDIQKVYDVITERGIDVSEDEILEKYLSIK